MKEVKCDHCGQVIKGYYPDNEMKSIDLYKLDITCPGTKKEKINCILTIDFKYGNKPVNYNFCSLDCLSKHLEHLEEITNN